MTYPQAVQALAKGTFVPAIATIAGHLQHYPDDGPAWMFLGIAYSETGHFQAAIRALERASLIMDESAELDEAFGCTFLRMEEYDVAQQYLERAARFSDCPASVYRNLSILFLKTQRLQAALGAIETALEMDDDDARSLYGKVIILKQIETTTGKGRDV